MTADVASAGGSPTLAAFVKPAVSEIRYGSMRFLITGRPNAYAIESFIKELKRYGADTVVRVCQPSYPTDRIERANIRVIDWEFADGEPPSADIIDKWLELVRQRFETSPRRDSGVLRMIRDRRLSHYSRHAKDTTPSSAGSDGGEPPAAIAVHCVSGLGRAPVLVALALLEAGLGCEDVIFLIRTNRRGALNETQLKFLRDYKPSGRLRKLRYAPDNGDAKTRQSCAIM